MVGKPEKGDHYKHRNVEGVSIQMDLRERKRSMDWIHLAQDKDQ
jgi:hypothetical protein